MAQWANINSIYQIYPRSFMDSDDDGIGDLNGITEKLEYLRDGTNSLGIDAIWLSPFYTSPMRDFGYDISDYRGVDPIFGNLADFDSLLTRAHELGIAVMIDLVPNHTSSEHPWFREALENPDSDKRDYYTFRHSDDGTPPNNWLSVFGGSAWSQTSSGEYYLHSFLPEQPDLNWRNPAVREEMREIVRFWLARGVDGLRVDAIRWMAKDAELRDDPINPEFQEGQDPYNQLLHINSRYRPELDDYLRVITDTAREFDDRLVIFEDHLDDLSSKHDQIRRIYNIDPKVSAPFNFQGMFIPFSAQAFGQMIESYQECLPTGARAYYCLSNHDEHRLVSRFGERQARLLAVMQLSLPGIPVVYYGQEIGMTDVDIPESKLSDRFEINVPGKGKGRDPERTPMQWGPGTNAGFSKSDETWLPVGDNYREVNVANQTGDQTSSLELYRKLLRLREVYPVLRGNSYQTITNRDDVLIYRRQDHLTTVYVALNFSEQRRNIGIQGKFEVLLSAQSHEYDGNLEYLEAMDAVVIRKIVS